MAALRTGMMDVINTRYDNEYVFAHVATTSPPMDATGAFTYDPDTYDTVRSAEIGPGRLGEIGASGSHAFAQRAADPASVDVVALLQTLTNDLTANDPDALRSRLDSLEAAFDQVVAERARTGLRTQRLRDADLAADQSQTLYSQLRSDLVEADAAEAFSRVTLAQASVEAAVAVASRVLGPSLLDRL
jgi:flagellin-like hook-associated protein FlgL